jgi:ABC-type glycerol-3-phosphate transport system permease component
MTAGASPFMQMDAMNCGCHDNLDVAYVFVHRECSITLYPRQLYRHLDCPPGSDRNVWEAFINTFTVTIPSTIIPIAVALFAAYAFSWMNFPGRLVLFAVVVGFWLFPYRCP